MSTTFLVLLAVVMIVGGLYNLFAKGTVWKGQQLANEMAGVRSERTPMWNSWRTMIGVIGVVIGGIILGYVVVSIVASSKADHSVIGDYTCNGDNPEPRYVLQIKGDGTGQFEETVFSWVAGDGGLIFEGDGDLVSGAWVDRSGLETLELAQRDGGRIVCWRE